MSTIESVKEIYTVKSLSRNSWLPKGHDGEARYTGCSAGLQPSVSRKTGQLVTGLTKEDETRLEEALFMDKGTLNKFNTKFWADYWIRIPKDGLKLDLSNPEDELKYLVLKADHKVATSENDAQCNMYAEFVMTSEESEAKFQSTKIKIKKDAYSKFSKMTFTEQINFLKVYEGGKNKIGLSATPEFLESTVGTIVEENPEAFLKTLEDPYFKVKVLIEDCIAARAVQKMGTKYFITGNPDPIGMTLLDTIETLNDPKNQDLLISLKSKLEAYNKTSK